MSAPQKKQIVLASQSPRRQELLKKAGISFLLYPVQISEIVNENLNLYEQIQDLARRKAEALLDANILDKRQGLIILAADTIVALENKIMGKPANEIEWRSFLRQLSGRVHKVITGFCLWDLDTMKQILECDETNVEFRVLTEKDIDLYVQTGEGWDKAGGYAIQGKARHFVAGYNGDFENVVGLPVARIEKILKEMAWDVCRE